MSMNHLWHVNAQAWIIDRNVLQQIFSLLTGFSTIGLANNLPGVYSLQVLYIFCATRPLFSLWCMKASVWQLDPDVCSELSGSEGSFCQLAQVSIALPLVTALLSFKLGSLLIISWYGGLLDVICSNRNIGRARVQAAKGNMFELPFVKYENIQ